MVGIGQGSWSEIMTGFLWPVELLGLLSHRNSRQMEMGSWKVREMWDDSQDSTLDDWMNVCNTEEGEGCGR